MKRLSLLILILFLLVGCTPKLTEPTLLYTAEELYMQITDIESVEKDYNVKAKVLKESHTGITEDEEITIMILYKETDFPYIENAMICQLVDECVLIQEGHYVLYVVSDKADEYIKKFRKILNGQEQEQEEIEKEIYQEIPKEEIEKPIANEEDNKITEDNKMEENNNANEPTLEEDNKPSNSDIIDDLLNNLKEENKEDEFTGEIITLSDKFKAGKRITNLELRGEGSRIIYRQKEIKETIERYLNDRYNYNITTLEEQEALILYISNTYNKKINVKIGDNMTTKFVLLNEIREYNNLHYLKAMAWDPNTEDQFEVDIEIDIEGDNLIIEVEFSLPTMEIEGKKII